MGSRAKALKKSCVIKDILAPFKLSDETLCNVMNRLVTAINQGLSKDTHRNAAVSCHQTYVYDFPDGTENGKFLAIDLGGMHFRVLLVELKNGKEEKFESRIYSFPDEKLEGTSDEFFDYIVECLKTFREELKIENEKLPLGFCFGFPLEMKSLSSAVLVRWAKRFNVKGVVGKDIGELFKKALEKKKVEIGHLAFLNDTTGCLLSCAYKKDNCRIGVIIGTGTNAAYYEKKENIELWNGKADKNGMVVNTEWADFGVDGSLNDLLTEFDLQLDTSSARPGSEIFEKMLSVMYVCELIRLVIMKCVNMKYLFGGEVPDKLRNKGSFLPEFMYKISSAEVDVPKIMNLLETLNITSASAQDCVNIHYISEIICKRSAHLLSVGISTLINKMSVSPIAVGIDGGMYRNHPTYKDILKEKIRCMINPQIQFELVLSEDGSGRGAALVVASIK